MRKVIFKEKEEEISHNEVDYERPIFAKRNGKLVGMLVEEPGGWILRLGKRKGSAGHSQDPVDCMKDSLAYGYTFHVA